jgi:hypothetical protein
VGNLRRLLNESKNEKKIITPYVRAALTNPAFQGFWVEVEGWTPRPYDGYFHPSTHSTWTARQLSYYLTNPDELIQEQPDLLFVLAVTQGKFWHKFIQLLLLAAGILVEDEVPLKDLVYNRKGHADGRLYNGEYFEFKTMNERSIRKVKTIQDLIMYHPDYYAQTQDYLDVLGAESMRYFIMALASPFPMQEFVVPADPAFQAAQREKYRQAIVGAETEIRPDFCCQPRSLQSKSCPVRLACPMGAKVA